MTSKSLECACPIKHLFNKAPLNGFLSLNFPQVFSPPSPYSLAVRASCSYTPYWLGWYAVCGHRLWLPCSVSWRDHLDEWTQGLTATKWIRPRENMAVPHSLGSVKCHPNLQYSPKHLPPSSTLVIRLPFPPVTSTDYVPDVCVKEQNKAHRVIASQFWSSVPVS